MACASMTGAVEGAVEVIRELRSSLGAARDNARWRASALRERPGAAVMAGEEKVL